MEIIDTQEKLDELVSFAKSSNKRICRMGISGDVHEGHIFVLEKIRKDCDILIADFNEYISESWNFLSNRTIQGFPTPSLAIKALQETEIVDFVIFNKSTEEYQKRSIDLVLKHQDKFYSYCKELGLSKDLAVNCMIFGILSPIDEVTTSYVGPKCVAQVKIANKIFGNKVNWNPEFIWDFRRNPAGGSVSRRRNSIVLSKTVSNVVTELKRGIVDFKSLEQVTKEYYMEKPGFSIIDLNTVEKVDHITDNCSIIIMDDLLSDFIHIKNGELVT